MSIPDAVKVVVESSLISFNEQRIPEHVRDKVRLSYRFRGNSVTMYEERIAFVGRGGWVEIVVAQFRFDPEQRTWTLYCADRNSRWHKYLDLEPNDDFELLLQEVHEDPTGIFWG
jgi:hypothetical protein